MNTENAKTAISWLCGGPLNIILGNGRNQSDDEMINEIRHQITCDLADEGTPHTGVHCDNARQMENIIDNADVRAALIKFARHEIAMDADKNNQ